MALPPWLNVQPADFVAAAQSGAKVGQGILGIRTRAASEANQVAAGERENAARVAAEQQRIEQQGKEADAARALKEFETQQQLQMQQQRMDEMSGEFKTKHELDLRKVLDTEKGKTSPIYHTVENQLLKTDPTTGKTESLYTAPFRPSAGGALRELLSEGSTSTGTGGGGSTPERVRVKSPDGQVGTISSANLDEAIANGYTRVQ